jgi:hypothetical protein
MGARLLSLPMPRGAYRCGWGFLVAAASIPAETFVVDPLAGDERREEQA